MSLLSKIENILSSSHSRDIGFIAMAVVILSTVIFTLHVAQSQQTVEQHASSGTSFEGNAIYDNCGVTCFSHLDTFAHGGFKMIMDYSSFVNTHITAVQAYAQHAQADNIKIIWSFKDFYPKISGTYPSQSKYYSQIAQDCGCNDWVSLTKYLVNQVKNDPATWGYYISDEPKNYGFTASNIAPISSAISSLDPSHPKLLINNDTLNNGNSTYAVNLANYVSVANVLGEDYYPISYGQNINNTGAIANEVQYIANTYNRQSAMVLELNSGNNPSAQIYPSFFQMQSMYSQVLGHSTPRLILWFWYANTPSSQYTNLVKIISPPTNTPTPSPTVTLTPTLIPTATPTITPKPTVTPTPSPRPTAIPSPTSTPVILLGDINKDGVVNILDYNLLISCYGKKFYTSICIAKNAADLNGDGVVNGIDYNILLRAFIAR